VSAFAEPTVVYARRTLTAIVGILAAFLIGIACLAKSYHIGAMDQTQPGYQSILSQLSAAVLGHSTLYYMTIGSLLAVLSLSANTSFVGFPRLCRLVAQDGFLPHPFVVVGRRLVFTVGILFLAASSGLLLILFGGITDHLIPLFAVGAFLAFTLSQAGMVMHWYKSPDAPRAPAKRIAAMAVNGVGAVSTAIALAIIIAAKFLEGAWIIIVVIPTLIFIFRRTKRYYDWIAAEICKPLRLDLSSQAKPIVLVPVMHWNRLTGKALHFAMRLSPEVIGVHLRLLDDPTSEATDKLLRQQWSEHVEQEARNAGAPVPKLEVLDSEYRTFSEPLLGYIGQLERDHPRRAIAVVLPEIVKKHWWQHLLHSHRAAWLRGALLKQAGPRVVVVNIPWDLEPAGPARLRDTSPED
jgi:hypothetical protein